MFNRFLATLAILALSACSGTSSPFDSYRYLDSNAIDPASLGKPLAEGSAAKKKEINAIIAMQKKPSKKELEIAFDEHKHIAAEWVTMVADPKLNRDDQPITFRMLDDVKEDCLANVEKAKVYWNATRPYLADKRVKALVENPNTNGAYPSGHTACGKVMADVMADIMPQKRKALAARAESIGKHRILLGVHYPNDVAAGKKLAAMFYTKLKQSGAFQQDMKAAKAEVAPKKMCKKALAAANKK